MRADLGARLGSLAVLLVAIAGVGCADDSPDNEPGGREATRAGGSSVTSSTDSARPSPQGGAQAPTRSDDSHVRTTTLPNGTIVIQPLPPTNTAVPPGKGCASATIDRDGAKGVVKVPPRPGLSARASGRVVHVRYDTGAALPRCAPDFMSILVDDNDDPRPPVARRFFLRAGRAQSLTIRLPAYFAGAPNVVRATTGTRDGRLSPTARAQIVDWSNRSDGP
jgi:hypothetical protein